MLVRQVIVECRRDGKLIARYPLGVPDSLVLAAYIDRQKLIEEVKHNLSNDRLAFPPYDGVTFDVMEA